MEERQVTLEGETRALPRPFLLLATQNPIELEGTFPLPEAQLDRFMIRLGLGYPTLDEERAILRRFRQRNPLDELTPVVGPDELSAAQRACRTVHVGDAVEQYLLELVRSTREHPAIELGASPRASLALYRGAQALAAIHRRSFAIPDDVKRLARPVLAHRMIATVQSRLRGQALDELVGELVGSIAVPVEEGLTV
jgi:MoxR-like ATPase